ncbi:hypothetical protein SESBI_16906 [Sesbania bispinosa]|nr:hypothetical protein SESBI_16906 [Sesbania bispinosa]
MNPKTKNRAAVAVAFLSSSVPRSCCFAEANHRRAQLCSCCFAGANRRPCCLAPSSHPRAAVALPPSPRAAGSSSHPPFCSATIHHRRSPVAEVRRVTSLTSARSRSAGPSSHPRAAVLLLHQPSPSLFLHHRG